MLIQELVKHGFNLLTFFSPMMQAQQICNVDKMQLNCLPDVNKRQDQ